MLTSITDILLIIVRWIHICSAVIWVGGGMFYLIAVHPINYVPNKHLNELMQIISKNLTNISDISILSLTSTGAIIMLNALLKQNLTMEIFNMTVMVELVGIEKSQQEKH